MIKAARVPSPLPITGGYDHITIMNGMIGYIAALEKRPKRIFKLSEIQKLLVVKRNLSCWTKDHKLDPWAKIGTEIEVFVLTKDGTTNVLIPAFLIKYGKKKWDCFLQDLSDSSGLPLEELSELPRNTK
jgi:hypothetical protein